MECTKNTINCQIIWASHWIFIFWHSGTRIDLTILELSCANFQGATTGTPPKTKSNRVLLTKRCLEGDSFRFEKGGHVGVSKNSGISTQIIHFNRVFYYFHHPFWGTPIFGNPHVNFWGDHAMHACKKSEKPSTNGRVDGQLKVFSEVPVTGT